MTQKIAYLGPKFSYSYMMAKKLAKKGCDLVPHNTLRDVMNAVDDVTDAVIPLENSLEGSINETLDALVFGNGLYITRREVLPIDHRIFALKGVRYSDITTVKTHPQAYAQCVQNLKNLFPQGLNVEFCASTSAAVLALDNVTCAIAGVQNNNKALSMGQANVSDNVNNTTAFAYISKAQNTSNKANKIMLCFSAQNDVGGLLQKLHILKDNGINITFIQSRPSKAEIGNYIFIAEIEAKMHHKKTIEAIEQLGKDGGLCKVIGVY